MIEVRNIDADTYYGTSRTHCRGFQEMEYPLVPYCLYEVGHNHADNDKQVIVSHLHMVCQHLESREYRRNEEAAQVTAPEAQHHAGYHWWQICESLHLPVMACSNDNEEIG